MRLAELERRFHWRSYWKQPNPQAEHGTATNRRIAPMTLNEPPRAAVADTGTGDDAYLWLEVLDGEEVLDWVKRHNEPTLARLSSERFEQMRAEALQGFEADSRIPSLSRHG